MKLVFMGTPEFAVPSLSRLLQDGYEIAAVFTQPDKASGRGKQVHLNAVKIFALEQGLALHQPAKIKTNQEVRAAFESIAPDACIVAAYGKILPEWLLNIPRLGCINVHASLLPKYRGAAPVNWSIVNGEQGTGVTIMQMDAGMDTGPMLAKRATRIGPEETADQLSRRLSVIGAELLSETLPDVARGTIEPIPQDDSQATYAPLLKREHGFFDWSLTATEISNRVRGFQPWPGTYTDFRGHRLIIWEARPVAESNGERAQVPSSILELNSSGMLAACGGSTIINLIELQIEGKRRMRARDFANGMRLKVGDRLTDATE